MMMGQRDYQQGMSNLKKLKSQELIDRLFSINIKKNYYEHHHLPARTLNLNFLTRASSSFKVNRGKIDREKSPKNNSRVSDAEIGRELYPQITKRVEDPGPGAYDWTLSDPKSHRFTVSNSNLKARSKQQKIGPSSYKYEEVANNNVLSHNRRPINIKLNNCDKKQDRLVFKASDVPGPGRYDSSSAVQKTSKFQDPIGYKMSMTSRSSMIRKQEYPGGPGYYKWETYYSKQKQKQKQRPCIEYKFVYGHPS